MRRHVPHDLRVGEAVVGVAAEDRGLERGQGRRLGGDGALVVEGPHGPAERHAHPHPVRDGPGRVPPLDAEAERAREPVEGGGGHPRPGSVRPASLQGSEPSGDRLDGRQLGGELEDAAVERVLREHHGAEGRPPVRDDAGAPDPPVVERRGPARPGRHRGVLGVAQEREAAHERVPTEVVARGAREQRPLRGAGRELDQGAVAPLDDRSVEADRRRVVDAVLRADVTDDQGARPVHADVESRAVDRGRAVVVEAPLHAEPEADPRGGIARPAQEGRAEGHLGLERRRGRPVGQAVQRAVGSRGPAHEQPVPHPPVLQPVGPVRGSRPAHVRPVAPVARERGVLRPGGAGPQERRGAEHPEEHEPEALAPIHRASPRAGRRGWARTGRTLRSRATTPRARPGGARRPRASPRTARRTPRGRPRDRRAPSDRPRRSG